MKVVIIGAGFGGLKLARKLNNKPGFEVLLIDKFNYHQFQPLFYQVATAELDASNISFPLRKVFHNSKNVRIRVTALKQVIPAENKIVTEAGDISYDILVLAMGADTNFFGKQQMKENAFPMKSTVEALQLRHRLIQNFEDALNVTDETELQGLLTVVVTGGGPTGVEVSGKLAEMKKYVLPKDYPELDFSRMNIYLLEGADKILSAMSEKSSQQSRKYLERLGVTVMTNTLVKDYDGSNVLLEGGKNIPARTMIWAAGIKGNIPDGLNQYLKASGCRIKTDRRCLVQGFDNVYAIGDMAYMETPKYPDGHPQVAPVAMQQAAMLADNLIRTERKSLTFYDFEYQDKGSMATVGRHLAVADVPVPIVIGSKLHFGGFVAWMIWMGLHLMLILGVKNRLFVFLNWMYSYITYDQSLRLIFKEFYKAPKKTHEDFDHSSKRINALTTNNKI